MARFLHTMVRITDPEKSRAFYEALGFTFERDMEIVRNGELEATNYFFGIGDQTVGARADLQPRRPAATTSAPATGTSRVAAERPRSRRSRS